MSPMEAAPVARHGDPKYPWRNRKAINPPKLVTVAVGTHKMIKRVNVMTYGGFLPTAGTSLSGENSSGPRPSVFRRFS